MIPARQKISNHLLIKQAMEIHSIACFIGVFRRGNKPSVLPREEKRAELQKKKASFMRAESGL